MRRHRSLPNFGPRVFCQSQPGLNSYGLLTSNTAATDSAVKSASPARVVAATTTLSSLAGATAAPAASSTSLLFWPSTSTTSSGADSPAGRFFQANLTSRLCGG